MAVPNPGAPWPGLDTFPTTPRFTCKLSRRPTSKRDQASSMVKTAWCGKWAATKQTMSPTMCNPTKATKRDNHGASSADMTDTITATPEAPVLRPVEFLQRGACRKEGRGTISSKSKASWDTGLMKCHDHLFSFRFKPTGLNVVSIKGSRLFFFLSKTFWIPPLAIICTP